MAKRIGAVAFIFVFTSLAWLILGMSTNLRTSSQDQKLRKEVGQLWGDVQKQHAPDVFTIEIVRKIQEKWEDGKEVIDTLETVSHVPTFLDSSSLNVDLHLEHRKKGLLWYSTYVVTFYAKYSFTNRYNKEKGVNFHYPFPVVDGIYDDFMMKRNGDSVECLNPVNGKIQSTSTLRPGQQQTVEISYKSQGSDEWWYIFGESVSQIRNFNLTMTTDFDDINFPENSISPTAKEKTDTGWRLKWDYSNLISGIQIGMEMPRKLNPGPFVSRVSFFAPVSLFFFFFIIFLITTLKNINLHPMNYFFIAAAFFAFHLLLAYLVDHVDIHLACAICSVVSIFLVISYMRLVVGLRFALIETGVSQFVYLVLFSYAFFLEGYTGLAITISSIVTLFIVMQFTGRIDWTKQKFGTEKKPAR
ncbi:MAG: inner membrane CreD family protein [candidate division Zixibacteria bacterium]|nr:inner membrane CreD family protein [candidate division Zixibacteria bacterium]MBU1469755.1 inner membrane CreD family protein [candidate division Zixibacteria bacterium]MBU2624963.1 inner membrane CreD family protein [candidate division Zixibacteria bacterium]